MINQQVNPCVYLKITNYATDYVKFSATRDDIDPLFFVGWWWWIWLWVELFSHEIVYCVLLKNKIIIQLNFSLFYVILEWKKYIDPPNISTSFQFYFMLLKKSGSTHFMSFPRQIISCPAHLKLPNRACDLRARGRVTDFTFRQCPLK